MEETGGTLEDYVNLNQDFSKYDDMTVLKESITNKQNLI